MSRSEGRFGRGSREIRRNHFLAFERARATAASRWLGHPLLPGLAARWRGRAEAVMAPIADHLEKSTVRPANATFYEVKSKEFQA